ncbi:DUF1146 family protein [Lysinibacillus telephonicus]|uniref:DUF1146 family protein n=1 Tax=Lysinibacillus telephonicus TaxID=1714840 RepID=UPI0031FD5DFC
MEVYHTLGIQSVLGIFSHLLFIAITFYALQAFRLDQLFKKGRTVQIQLIYILLSIAIGSSVSNFVLDFSNWSQKLHYIFS